ncbi:sugar transferase [Symmachiella dynata]|uniref:UDP-glucose:undecaprenyl-phosphate glucose-1-phosphate transferase n=1 Tax=Symmachiella dynata TaxID=2527995 RepID=A0A517ZHJ4_9PLAN|nr:sugar transferase [Symmachiella dynata]QDT46440.1 UDP-glucose:undecaprenyl-phosphate glucose-1-phosphate transferase [Symmachiella dynata]QDU41941.1 UDP-glucose:undecaprenyl-phosphate glucose-1-phosphate transferase [Symmachiella dynata]
MMKRMFDLLVSFCGLLLLWPVLLVSAVLVKLTSPGPALYRQQRMGLNFQPFDILKFRTMVVDAHKLGGQITAGRDPRITSVGHFLRKTKIDELPQLINVFKGEMSFVGPRPEVPRYVEMFRDDYAELLKVRPGITDIASLKYRHESELLGESDNPETTYTQVILPDKIALAKEYIRRSSILFDLQLIFKTVLRMAE